MKSEVPRAAPSRAEPGEIRRALDLLCAPREVYELRALETCRGGIVSGYYDDIAQLARDAGQCSDRLGATGTYLTINPTKSELLHRAANRLREFVKKDTTADRDISWRCWLALDFDPIRPSGIAATEEEHAAALAKAKEVRAFLVQRGWGEGLLIASGNGAYILYPIDLPNDDASAGLLKRALEALSMWFDDTQVNIDRTMFNASRIIRIPGTVNRKGDNLTERPHRVARVLDAPEWQDVVSREQLEALAALVPKVDQRTSSQSNSRFELDAFLARYAIAVKRVNPYQGGRRLILESCVFDPGHGGTSAAIIELANGGLAYVCQHNSCADKHWKDIREKYEPGHWNRSENARSTEASTRTYLGFDSVDQVRDQLMALDAKLDSLDKAYTDEFVAAAAALEHFEPAEFARLGNKLKARGLSLTRWERFVRECGAKEKSRSAAAVKQVGATKAASNITLGEVAPQATAVTDGALLLSDVKTFIARFVRATELQLVAITLWIGFTYAFEIAEVSPRLALVSVKKRCGKSTLESVLGLLCPRPLRASNISTAVLYRVIEEFKPTLLLDEVDSFVFNSRARGTSERSEELRGLVNSGHTRDGASVLRNEKVGNKLVPRSFSTWAPIVYAAIGRLPDTWEDRAIRIAMKRRLRSEAIEKLTRRNLKTIRSEAEVLAAKLARWVADNLDSLRAVETEDSQWAR